MGVRPDHCKITYRGSLNFITILHGGSWFITILHRGGGVFLGPQILCVYCDIWTALICFNHFCSSQLWSLNMNYSHLSMATKEHTGGHADFAKSASSFRNLALSPPQPCSTQPTAPSAPSLFPQLSLSLLGRAFWVFGGIPSVSWGHQA